MSHTIVKKRASDLKRLFEVNYTLLMRLAPDLDLIPDAALSTSDECVDIYIKIIERTRYTTTLSLTHYFEAGDALIPAPDLWIRVYHDARVAEAVPRKDGSTVVHGRIFTRNKTLDADIKWKLNDFTEKWLRYCLARGHRFECDDTLPDVNDDRSLLI
jgi:uncharacterized protein YqiB (DUF1249 family)